MKIPGRNSPQCCNVYKISVCYDLQVQTVQPRGVIAKMLQTQSKFMLGISINVFCLLPNVGSMATVVKQVAWFMQTSVYHVKHENWYNHKLHFDHLELKLLY